MFFSGGKRPAGRMLLVSNDEIYSHRMMKRAQDYGFTLQVTKTLAGLRRSNLKRLDIVVLNFDGEDGATGIEVAEFLYRKYPMLAVIFVSGLTGVWQDPGRKAPNVLENRQPVERCRCLLSPGPPGHRRQ